MLGPIEERAESEQDQGMKSCSYPTSTRLEVHNSLHSEEFGYVYSKERATRATLVEGVWYQPDADGFIHIKKLSDRPLKADISQYHGALKQKYHGQDWSLMNTQIGSNKDL